MTIASNVLKEKTRRKDFYIIAVLGVGFALLIGSASSSITVAGVPVTSFKGLFPIMLTMINGLGCALAVVLSLTTIPNEYRRQTSHLVWIRGVKQYRYHASLCVGNLAASFFSLLVLYVGAVLFMLLKGETTYLPRLPVAYLISLIPVAVCSVAATAFSLKIPLISAGMAATGLQLLGLFHPMLQTLANMVTGFGGQLVRLLLAVLPNLFDMQNQASQFVLGHALDVHQLLKGLLFVYLFSLLLVVQKRKAA